MCTAITYQTADHYFGRNLDYEHSIPCAVTVTPRNLTFRFQNGSLLQHHHAMIGMSMVEDAYPLYFDATNEYGLSIAGLNFPGNAVYLPYEKNKINITPYELTPWILGQFKSVDSALMELQAVNLLNVPFRKDIPLSPLHWILADQSRSVTLEATVSGFHIYDNPVGVLTNNPPFDYHMHHLCEFMNLTASLPENRFSRHVSLKPYSRGMGAIGLPGDLSSASRFVRAAFTKLNSRSSESEDESVTQFFHILDSVFQTNGCAQVGNSYEKTLYSSCCNIDKGIYYYTTYENRQITGIEMYKADLNGKELYTYPLKQTQAIFMEP